MRVKGLAWMGIRVKQFEDSVRFFRDVMLLRIVHEEEGFCVFELPNGNKVEVFGSHSRYNRHFGSCPVVGFLVDNIEKARNDLKNSGTELVGDLSRDERGYAWQHFRGPDGNLYELVYEPERPTEPD